MSYDMLCEVLDEVQRLRDDVLKLTMIVTAAIPPVVKVDVVAKKPARAKVRALTAEVV